MTTTMPTRQTRPTNPKPAYSARSEAGPVVLLALPVGLVLPFSVLVVVGPLMELGELDGSLLAVVALLTLPVVSVAVSLGVLVVLFPVCWVVRSLVVVLELGDSVLAVPGESGDKGNEGEYYGHNIILVFGVSRGTFDNCLE